jgi:nucleotide-binding universal stress UspA family protein
MKTILLPFHDDDIDQAALDTALLHARRFNGYLEGLFVWQPPQIIAGAGEGITLYGDYVTQIAAEGRQLAAQARERFERLMQERGIALRDSGASGEGPTAGWYEGEGLEDRVVGDYGRVFDLIVIGRTGRPSSGDWQATCEAALFESGRPILLAPPSAPVDFGKNILIAWNGSTETSRTIALGMPLLQRSDKVVVLSVEGGSIPGPSSEQVATQLVRNGINATAKTVPLTGSVGESILQQVAETETDLLFKGAYTQSRLRQMIFGGATRHIVSHAQLPVLMAH